MLDYLQKKKERIRQKKANYVFFIFVFSLKLVFALREVVVADAESSGLEKKK